MREEECDTTTCLIVFTHASMYTRNEGILLGISTALRLFESELMCLLFQVIRRLHSKGILQ